MPEEPALTCMRAGASLWCNCSNGEGQRPAQPVRDIKAQMWTQRLGFLAAVSVLFEDGGRLLHRQVFGNRWKSPFNFVAAKKVYALGGLTCSVLLRYCVLSLDQHDCEPFIQAVRLIKSLPPTCVAIYMALLPLNIMDRLFYSCSSFGSKHSTLNQSTLYKKETWIINFLYKSSAQIYCWKVVTASPLLWVDVILFVLFLVVLTLVYLSLADW